MPRRRLTIRTIDTALKAPAGTRRHLWDDVVHGLALRVTDTGHKSWVVVRRVRGETRKVKNGQRQQGRVTRYTLGSYPDLTLERARREAKIAIEDMVAGVNPIAKRRGEELAAERREKGQFEKALDKYLARVGDNLRSGKELRRIFKKYVTPDWGRHQLHDITRRDVAELLDKIEQKNGAAMATRALDALRAFLNWFARRDETYASPIVRGMAPTQPKDVARSRVLTDPEIRALWQACDQAKPKIFGALVKLLLLTGQRRDDWASARHDELAGDVLIIPAVRYKTELEHGVPLSPATLAVLQAIDRLGDYLITTTGDAPFSGFSKAKAAIDVAMLDALFEASGETSAWLPNWRLHDLRRTARSLMARAGVRPDHAERVLGHVIRGVEGTYDRHRYEEEKRTALEALAGLVARIVAGTAGAVIPFGAARRAAAGGTGEP